MHTGLGFVNLEKVRLVVQWLTLHASSAGGAGSIRDCGTKISHATQKKKERKGTPKCTRPECARRGPRRGDQREARGSHAGEDNPALTRGSGAGSL